MAGVGFNANSGEVVMVNGVAKTVLQVRARANQRAVIKALRILGKQPAGGTDTPGRLRLTFSSANFGTGSGGTIARTDPSQPETVQTAVAANFTVEPTTPTDSSLAWEIQPQGGVIEFLPPGMEIPIPGGYAANFELTIAGTPTVQVCASGEE